MRDNNTLRGPIRIPSENDEGFNHFSKEMGKEIALHPPPPLAIKPLSLKKQKLNSLLFYAKKRLIATGNNIYNFLRHYASWMSFLQTVSRALSNVPALVLRITDFISPISRIIGGFKMLSKVTSNKESKLTRAITFFAGLGSIALGIVAMIFPLCGLIFATTNIASMTFVNGWVLGSALIKRFREKHHKNDTEEKKLTLLEKDKEDFYSKLCDDDPVKDLVKFKAYTKFKNKDTEALNDPNCLELDALEQHIFEREHSLFMQQREVNLEITRKTHDLVLSLIALGSIIMVFFPPTAIPAAFIFIATSVYGMAYNYNFPLKWVTRARDYFFKPHTLDSMDTTKEKIQMYKLRKKSLSSTATTTVELQNNKHLLLEPKSPSDTDSPLEPDSPPELKSPSKNCPTPNTAEQNNSAPEYTTRDFISSW